MYFLNKITFYLFHNKMKVKRSVIDNCIQYQYTTLQGKQIIKTYLSSTNPVGRPKDSEEIKLLKKSVKCGVKFLTENQLKEIENRIQLYKTKNKNKYEKRC